MPVKHPQPGELEPIETASRDELQSLQLQRLKQTGKGLSVSTLLEQAYSMVIQGHHPSLFHDC